MDNYEILKNALCAVKFKQTEARNQVRVARDLNNESLLQFWEKEVEEAESTYRGLMALLMEASSG